MPKPGVRPDRQGVRGARMETGSAETKGLHVHLMR
jgi:hypothetical protein